MFSFFKMPADKLRERQLAQAEVELLEYTHAAEHYRAMQTLLSGRVSRLRAEVEANKAVWPGVDDRAAGAF